MTFDRIRCERIFFGSSQADGPPDGDDKVNASKNMRINSGKVNVTSIFLECHFKIN